MTDTKELIERVDAAIERITSGNGQMRVPVDETDPDVVLAACAKELERLTQALAAAEARSRTLANAAINTTERAEAAEEENKRLRDDRDLEKKWRGAA